MNAIDYIYRFDPENPAGKPVPATAEEARRTLEHGNQMFARWMDSCHNGTANAGESRYIVPCNGYEVGMAGTPAAFPKQAPFAVVMGCSDARVPMEMLFGQGFNDLFVIRVAGNVLGDECIGSIDFALHALSQSVKVVVMIGHSGCGAVTGAVDAYLNPLKFWSKSSSIMLRSILQRIFVAVREAANGLETVWGPAIREHPKFREVLIDSSVALNAAQSAYNLRTEVERAGQREIEVLYGVFNLLNHRVISPARRDNGVDKMASLSYAPTNPQEFRVLAIALAESYRSQLFEQHGQQANLAASGSV